MGKIDDQLNARIGDLWQVAGVWCAILDCDPKSYILVRRVGRTTTWMALQVETSVLETVSLCSGLYERVN
jgi:hypothetical protein